MIVEEIKTKDAPKAIGPYSQAMRAGDFVFTSGQIAMDPGTGKLLSGGIREQAGRVLENLKAVLQAAGCRLENVVKTTVYLSDMGDFSEMNEVYEQFFGSSRPARTTIEVSRLPKDVRVEIDAVAVR
jgi:2-iminobutanoate/2-iminopropanoate deaminase